MLATGEESHFIRLWELSSGQCVLELEGHSGPVSSVAFLANAGAGGHLLLVSGGEACRVWILAPKAWQGSSLGHFDSQEGTIGKRGGLEEIGRQGRTHQGPLNCDACIVGGHSSCFAVLEGHKGRITSVDVAMTPLISDVGENKDITSRDKEAIVTVVTGSIDMTARVWHLYLPVDCDGLWLPPPPFQKQTDDGIECSSSKPEGTLLSFLPVPLKPASTPIKWSLKWSLEGHSGGVWGVSLSPGQGRVATCSEDGTTRVWRMTDGKCSSVLGGHKESVWGVRFSPLRTAEAGPHVASEAGRVDLATASGDGTVRLWDLSGGNLDAGATAASLEGSLDASGTGCADPVMAAGEEDARGVGCLEGHTKRVTSLAFSPDGCLEATASTDETVGLLG